MNKIKQKLYFKDWQTILLAFLVPLFVMWLIFIAMKVYPFGDSSVLVLDLNGQYVYFFEGFRKIVTEGRSILYTWNRALGGEFLGIFAYYLASPFSLITVLFPKRMITEALLCIELLKCGACGATMTYYLHRSRPVNGKKTARVIFSTLYALCAYAVVYGHNTMWIDALIYLPLITLGIERLISRREFKLFVVTLYLCVSATFYIGYMVCIWVVLYFFYYYFAKNDGVTNNFYGESKHFVRSFARITLYSIIAVALAAWILFPTYKSLTFGKTTFQNTNYELTSKFTFFEFFSKFLFGSYDTVRPEGLPVLYCGIIVLVLAPLYFFSKKITTKEKISGGILTLILSFSMVLSTVDLFWHGLQRPNWLNYRYSFMLVFLLLVFAYNAFIDIEHFNYKTIAINAAAVSVLIFAVQAQKLSNTPDLSSILASFILVVIYLIALHPVAKGYLREGGALIVAIIVCVEAFVAGVYNLRALDEDVVISKRDSYLSYIDSYESIVNNVKESDASFYRMEKETHRKTNDPFSLDMKGLSNSTSTLNAAQIKFLNRMGYCSKSHWSEYLGGTPVSDSLLGIKYIIFNSVRDDCIFEIYASDDENSKYAYFNPYALSVGFATSDNINDSDKFNIAMFHSPFEMMNSMLGTMLGKNKPIAVFEKLAIEDIDTENLDLTYISGHAKYVPQDQNSSSEVKYTITTKDNGMVYCYIPSDYPREVKLYVNGTSKGTIFGNETDRIIHLGHYDKGTTLHITMELQEDNLYIDNSTDMYFASVNEDLLSETFTELQKGNFNVTEYSDTRLFGTVDIPKDRTTLFTSIPFDDGWVLKIDGEETQYACTADALISAKLSPGKHTVEFTYEPSSFTLGLYVSCGAFAAFAVAIVIDEVSKRNRKRNFKELYQSTVK